MSVGKGGRQNEDAKREQRRQIVSTQVRDTESERKTETEPLN